MVDSVAGRAALAVLTGPSTAEQKSGRKNPVLPFPLTSSQQAGGQRANPILRFDRPQISGSVFSSLQDNALLSASRGVVVGEERVRLEEELHRRIVVSETAGSPGSPGTTSKVVTTTTQQTSLDSAALTELQKLLQAFSSVGGRDYTDTRVVAAVSDNLRDFGERLNSDTAANALGEIIGRIDRSVIGQDGLQFSDLFRDPGLFVAISAGLDDFAQTTGSNQAAEALRNVVLRIGDPRLGEGNRHDNGHHDDRHHNDSARALGTAIDQLGRALEGNAQADAALGQFLDRLQARDRKGYSGQIASILSNALNDLQGGALDQQAVQQLQTAAQEIAALTDLRGRRDDRLRASAVAGLQDILDRYVSTTDRSVTTVTPGEPATPPTAPSRTVTVVESTTLVPHVEIAQRVVAVYQSVQDQIRPLRKLTEPPPPTVNLEALVQPVASDEKDDKRKGVVVAAPETGRNQPFGLGRQTVFGTDIGAGTGIGIGGGALRPAPGQLFNAQA